MKTTHARIKAVLMAEVTLFLGCILVSSTAAQTCVPSPAGLVSWWPGDGNATDIVDGNDGTLQGGTTFAPGKVGQAFRFDGVDDHVVVPNLDINTLTFDAWVKRDRTSVPGNFDRLLMSVNDNGWGVYFESDDTVNLTLVGISNVGSIGAITDTNWHHIAVTYDGSNACFSIDGNLDSCPAYAVRFNSLGGNYTIGSRGASEFFDGLIDEVEVYNRALSAAEIQAIVNAGSTGKCKPGAFASFAATTTLALGPQAQDDTFDLQATFTLGTDSTGINFLTDLVHLQVGTLAITIPAGSFQPVPDGSFVFEGVIEGVRIQALLIPPKGQGKKSKTFEFEASGEGANLTGTEVPVSVVLTIGDDNGNATLTEVEVRARSSR